MRLETEQIFCVPFGGGCSRPSLLAALFHLLQTGPRLIASEHDDLAKLVSEEASH